jgi:hypothetical protein
METTTTKFGGRLIRNKTAKCEVCGRAPRSKEGDELYMLRFYLGNEALSCIPCARQQGFISRGMTNEQIRKMLNL